MNYKSQSFIITNTLRCFLQKRKLTSNTNDVFKSFSNGNDIQFYRLPTNPDGVLVIISGWLGAKPKYIKKYVEFWNSKNFDVLCYQTRWKELIFPTRTFEPKSKKLVEAIHKCNDFYPKIIFHSFSSGCYLYASVIEKILQTPEYQYCHQNIKGVIYDSLADWPYTLTNRNAMTAFLGKSSKLLPIDKIRNDSLPALRKSSLSFPNYLCYPPFNFDKFQDKNRTLYANPFNIPGLFLFSDSDLLSNTFQIRRIIDHWKQRKISVSKKHWDKSEHVQHYRLHKNDYERQVNLFVARILNINIRI